MPFQSEKQRRYLHANHPEIANRWEAKYGLGGIAELNSQLNSLPEYYMPFPAAQGGRIGFDKGTEIPEKFSTVPSRTDARCPSIQLSDQSNFRLSSLIL